MIRREFNGKEQVEHFLNLKIKLERWKKTLFLVISILSVPSESRPIESRYRKLIFCFNKLFLSVHYASIVWELNVPISAWDTFSPIWYPIQYSRFDIICAKFNSSLNCTITVYSFYYTTFFLTILLFVLTYYKKKISVRLIYLVRKFLRFGELLGAPLCLILVLVFKYSLVHGTTAEYSENSSMDFSTLGVLMSLGCLIIVLIIKVGASMFDYDCRHPQASILIESKANSNTDLLSISVGLLSIIFYAFISNFVLYRALLIVIHAPVAGSFFYYFPYYKFYVNFIQSLPHLFVLASCLIMLVGYTVNSAFFCVLGLFMLNPLFFYLWYFALKYRLSKFKLCKTSKARTVWQLELCMRNTLINSKLEDLKDISYRFNNFFTEKSFKKRKFLVLWESSYYFFGCKNERLGQAKLFRNCIVKTSLEEDYQRYNIHRSMKKINCEKYEEYKLMQKLISIEKVKKMDKEACFKTYEFCKSLLAPNSSLQKLEEASKDFKKIIKKLKKNYSTLFSKYQDSYLLLDLYSSFVSSFYGDAQKSSAIINKRQAIEVLKKLKSNLIEQNPLMIMGTKDFDFGKIKYSNKELADLLQTSQAKINDRLVTDFFPVSIKILSLASLKKFKLNPPLTTIYMYQNDLFILNSKGFLVEVSLTIILLGFYQKLFLFYMEKLDIEREACLVYKKKILNHTEGLYDILGIKDISGCNIETVLNIDLKEFKIKDHIETYKNSKNILLTYKKADENVKVLHFYLTKNLYEKSISRNLSFDKPKQSVLEILEENDSRNSADDDANITSSNKFEDDNNVNDSKFSGTVTVASSQNIYLKFMHTYIEQSIRAIKYLKSILLISVTYKQIVIIILSNLGLLVYFTIEIESQVSQNSINILGQTLYSLTSLANLANVIQLSIPYDLSLIRYFIPYYNQAQVSLNDLRSNYTIFDSDWSSCPESKILFENFIPILEINNGNKTIKYKNMYDFINEILFISDQFINQITNRTYNIYNTSYLLQVNGLGQSIDFINLVLEKIARCQTNQATSLAYIKIYVIVVGVFVLGICILLTIPFVIFLQNRLNLLWNQIRTISQKNSNSLIDVCNHRLEEFHDIKDTNNKVLEISRSSIKFNYTTKYLIRLSVFLIIGSVFYITSNYIFYVKFESFLSNRPQILYKLIMMRISLTKLDYWTKEVTGFQSFKLLYPNYVPLSSDFLKKLSDTAHDLQTNTQSLLNPGYLELMGSSFYNSYLVDPLNSTSILEYGYYSSIQNIIFESLYISYSKDPNIVTIYIKFYESARKLGIKNEEFFQSINSYSKSVIQNYLQIFIMFSCFFCSLLLTFYFIYYYSLFLPEEKKINRLEFVSKIISSSSFYAP